MRKWRTSKRSPRGGGVIAEFPAGIFLLFLGFFFPMLGLSTWAYRTLFVYYATRDACSVAAKSPSHALAVSNADRIWKRDLGTWTEVQEVPGGGAGHQVFIVERPINQSGTSTENVYSARLKSYDTTSNVYLIRFVATTKIAPLIGNLESTGSWLNTKIPGFTAPFTLQTTHEEFVEDPDSLTN
jgi:hypothetical protein